MTNSGGRMRKIRLLTHKIPQRNWELYEPRHIFPGFWRLLASVSGTPLWRRSRYTYLRKIVIVMSKIYKYSSLMLYKIIKIRGTKLNYPTHWKEIECKFSIEKNCGNCLYLNIIVYCTHFSAYLSQSFCSTSQPKL